MQTRRPWLPVFVLALTLPLAAQDAPPAGAPSVDEMVAKLQARERAAKTVTLRMRSRTVVPDGPVFETEGSLRVLGTTHFHASMKMKAGDGMEGEHEVVRTPNATWTREVDPMLGEVFTQMSKETMQELEEAGRVLGDESGGGIPGQAEAPLGSAMLVGLGKRFALKVGSGKLVRDGLDHWVVTGEARPGEIGEAEGLPQPDRVELLVRALSDGPLAVVRMAQFAAAQEILAVEIDEILVDQPMTEASFKLDARGKRVLDVMEHPPAATQIRSVLDAARRKREKDAQGKAAGDAAKDGKKATSGK